ncbi:Dihydrolipoyllysine-residue acetyltransferase [Pseudonocardia dioxanivorans CB1190]|uniref:Dihydrolipoamide acetyltransferase component of pyruvate dehydrogenase complex n=1 Tax=Pseudonocardia dioxanivorans (strain ATCC 55486 / DSM 44775 / JCM 13855 / CB1190) TaxID=675635 RepID=F4CJM2_PSEUX|nr:dihydrolipoamide acetyltransferase family protein [Pseudonocardia dioxanivorans]AEA25882.1 Dihydrolipoyllysine-residue acetyltransferase [Pseudonocardia dioxanivorans CB1190]
MTDTTGAVEVRMPRLSESMAEGTIVRWLHESGAEVARGDELAEIETDKATVAFEADAAGVLHILAGEGETVPVGAVIAHVGGTVAPGATQAGVADQAVPASVDAAEAPAVAEPSSAETPRANGEGPVAVRDRGATGAGEGPATVAPGTAAPGAVSGAEPGTARVRVPSSPLARRRARELGVDLATVTGTGPNGRVVRADIEAAARAAHADVTSSNGVAPRLAAAPGAEAPAPAGVGTAAGARGRGTVLARTRTQRLTAERMTRSAREIPVFTLTADADMTAALDLRAALAAVADDVPGAAVPTVTDVVVTAAGRALARHPGVNAGIAEGGDAAADPVGWSRVNIGVAVETPAGLVVPVVTDVATRSLGALAAAARGLVARARDGRLAPAELDGATFTVSNLGMFGVREFEAVVVPGQAAILAVGAVRAEPGTGRTVMTLTLSCDHRVLDGAAGARFLRDLVGLLERPHALLLDRGDDAAPGKDDT